MTRSWCSSRQGALVHGGLSSISNYVDSAKDGSCLLLELSIVNSRPSSGTTDRMRIVAQQPQTEMERWKEAL